ncbi:hypothetical protein LV457_18270 [Mycobacterium sp. MYCO198283]|uniref:hypothetical protein n=1 Tax=Mycobacterium sp. MYCO198283 TaxID=2883505 RepID=UPI001E5639C6|nr:hypothetical protein [Mycobacterium sp. MYCO198283]MCG5434221.1 hypothetical protein [Mycobacterium sp. MYCO198283]
MSVDLPGTPSDEVPGVLAAGDGGIGTLFVSMATRHPHGDDAGYLRWHTLDHRPEQHRLPGVRASLRLVSTPQCRAARAAGSPDYDAVDHVMTYFFADVAGLAAFDELSTALGGAGRKVSLLPPVQRGVYDVAEKASAITAGADVLPWWPCRGVYLLLESTAAPTGDLLGVDGVAGSWSATARTVHAGITSAGEPGQSITYLFLADDPVEVASRLAPAVRQREPLLAAPLYPVVPWEWDRHVP